MTYKNNQIKSKNFKVSVIEDNNKLEISWPSYGAVSINRAKEFRGILDEAIKMAEMIKTN